MRDHIAAAHESGVREAPSFVVNGRLIDCESDIDRLQEVATRWHPAARPPPAQAAQAAQAAQTPAWR